MHKLIQSTLAGAAGGLQFLPSKSMTTAISQEIEPSEVKHATEKEGVARPFAPEETQREFLVGTFHGFAEDAERIRIKVDGIKMLGTGTLYVIGGASADFPDATVLPALRHRTLGYQFDLQRDVRIDCKSHKTDERFLFSGQLEELHAVVELSSRAATPAASQDKSELPSGESISKGAPKRGRRPRPAFADELRRIGDLQTAGLDPDVDIHFLVAYVRESRPTIYRKMKKGEFPCAQRRGGRVFWRLSIIEKYRMGRWVAETNLVSFEGQV